MTDLKTAYLVQASPRVMFHAQSLGSVVGAFVGSGVYRLSTVVYEILSREYPVPLAYTWANTARLANGGEVPRGVAVCTTGAFLLSTCLRAFTVGVA